MPDDDTALARIKTGGFAAHTGVEDTDPDDDTLTVHGVALGEGPAQGKLADNVDEDDGPTVYSPELLEQSADMLVGRNIVDDSDHDPEELDALEPPNESIVGEVTDAKHKPGVGLVYEGEIDRDPERSLVENGRVDVSPTVLRSVGEYDDDLGGKPAKTIAHFRDLAVVPNGGSPAASINAGPAPAEALSAEALTQTFADDSARARTGGGTKPDGEEVTAESMADPDNTEDEPTPGGEGGEPENGGDGEGGEDNGGGELASKSKEELVSLVEDLKGEKNDMKETLAELKGQVKALGGDVEALQKHFGPIQDQAVEAFAEKHDFDKEFVEENFDTADIIDELGGPEASVEALGLTPNPKTGEAGGSGEGGVAGLNDDDEANIESLMARADTYDGVNDEHAEALREQAADIAGVDDPEDVRAEVL